MDYKDAGFDSDLIRQNPQETELYDNVSVESLLADNAINGNKVVEIDFAKITNVEIVDAQIENVSATKILAGTITSQSIVLAANGSGDSTIRAGKTDFDNTVAGFILGIDDSDSDKPKFYIGDTTKYLNWDGSALTIRGTINADDITAGTLTGRTVKATGGAGTDVWMDSGLGYLVFKYGGSDKGFIYCDSSGSVLIDADYQVILQADGSGDDIVLLAGDDIFLSAGGTILTDTDMFVDGDLDITGDISADNFPDFAEYFEATPEFSSEKIPVGTSVVMVDGKIRPAVMGEIPFGVVSAAPGIILGAASKYWTNKYLRDDFGRVLKEEVSVWEKRNQKTRKLAKGVIEDGIEAPKGATIVKKTRNVLNPEWDKNAQYIPRKDRPEWNIVGLIGQIRVLKGCPVAPSWIKMRSVNENIDEYLVR